MNKEVIIDIENPKDNDLISRQAALEPYRILNNTDTLCVAVIRANIIQLPPVRPQEPKTGHWIAVYQGNEIINYRCSKCELGDTNGSTNLYGWNFCRRCGARMVEPQESEEV